MSLSNILEKDNPVTPAPWTYLHAVRYKGLQLEVGELNSVITVNGKPISDYLRQVASARFNLNPASNPGPIGGLLVPPASTRPGPFNIPLIASQDLDIAKAYSNDPDGYFTLDNDKITINKSGNYNISFNIPVLSDDSNNACGVQVVKYGQAIFTSPPLCSGFSAVIDITNTPVGGLYPYASECNGSANCQLDAGTDLSLVVYMFGVNTIPAPAVAEISLTANLSITLLNTA